MKQFKERKQKTNWLGYKRGRHTDFPPSIVRRMHDWTGTGCAFPLCESLIWSQSSNHLCREHQYEYDDVREDREWLYQTTLKFYEGETVCPHMLPSILGVAKTEIAG